MRTGRLLTSLLSACALTCLLSTAAFAQFHAQRSHKDPKKLDVPTGLNSTINLTSALPAIDDKSPMSNSLGPDPQLNGPYYTFQRRFIIDAPATVRSMTPTVIALYSALKRISPVQDRFPLKVPLNSPGDLLTFLQNTLNSVDPDILPVKPDTIAVLAVHRSGKRNPILNSLLLRDYLIKYFPGLTEAEQTTLTKVLEYSDKEVRDMNATLPVDIIHSALYVGVQVRGVGGPTVYTPEMIYSLGKAGQDYAAQAYLSGSYGYSLSARLDLTPGRPKMVEAVVKLADIVAQSGQRDVPPVPAGPEAANSGPIPGALRTAVLVRKAFLDDYSTEYMAAHTDATREVVEYSRTWRLALAGSERAVGGFGSLTSGGLSVSKLYFQHQRTYNGITLLGEAQVLQYAPDAGGDAATVRSGLAAFWQDRVSRLMPAEDGTQKGEIIRWQTQIGLEYNFHNSLEPEDSYGIFVKRRMLKFTELGLSVGRSSDGRAYVGFNLGHTISL